MPAACRPGGPRERALRPASHGTEGREPLRSRRWVLALPGPLAAGHRPQTPREAQRPRRPVAAGGVPSEFTTASTDLGGNERGWAALNEQGTVTSAPCSAHPGDEPEPGRCAAAPPARSAPFRPFPSRGTGAEVRAGPAPSPPCPSRAEPAAPAPRTAAVGRNRAARRVPSRRRPAGPAESRAAPRPRSVRRARFRAGAARRLVPRARRLQRAWEPGAGPGCAVARASAPRGKR